VAIPAQVTHTGSVSATPTAGSGFSGVPSLQDILNTSFSATYQVRKGAAPSVVGATDLLPFVLPFETITKARMFALRVASGSLKMLLTSAAGADQLLRVSSLFMWHAPNPGDELTAIKLVGTADIEYILCGDL
jgi:hypothetical protein